MSVASGPRRTTKATAANGPHAFSRSRAGVACKATSVGQPVPEICPECGGKSVESIDATAELVRLAGQQDRPIEVVEHCDPLMDLGGVGGLLRY